MSHNLGLIYEGYTISYANKDKDHLKPFIPFALNSDGKISTMIYPADSEGRGDIIIDCGFTKCFLYLKTTGTFKYIRNIAGWTARPEVHYKEESIHPCDWRPKRVKYKVNFNAKFNGYKKLENKTIENMKTIFVIDNSESTDNNNFYFDNVKKIIDSYFNKERGDKFYIWNSNYENLSEEKMDEIIYERIGEGNTYSLLIAEILKNEEVNFFEHLIIITDGDVKPIVRLMNQIIL